MNDKSIKVKNTKDQTILLLLTYQTYSLKICSLGFYYLQFNPMSMELSWSYIYSSNPNL